MTKLETITQQQLNEYRISRDDVVSDWCPDDFGLGNDEHCVNDITKSISCYECWSKEIE